MKNFARVAAIAAVSILSAGVAAADTINSSSATVSYLGFKGTTGTTPAQLASDLSTGAPAATFNIGTGGGVWAGPIGSSNFVSYNANTAPGGSVTAATGTYTYQTTFTVPGSTVGSITVLADDTTSVFLNGNLLVAPAAQVAGPKCTVGTPNCTNTMATYALSGLLSPGSNTLTFGVQQLFGSATGLDFVITTNAVPEPSSLMLLGTGLLGSAGMFFRRLRA